MSFYNSVDAAEDESLLADVKIDPYLGTKLGTYRETYCANYSNLEQGEVLRWIEDETMKLQKTSMLSGSLSASTLQSLIRMKGAKNVLEIGTYSGFTAIAMAAVASRVVTVDNFKAEPASEDVCRDAIKMAQVNVSIMKMDAKDALNLLVNEVKEPFDFVFIDGDKKEQIDYYEFLLKHPHLFDPKGVIAVDNTLWYSRVFQSDDKIGDEDTVAVRKFNDHIKRDPRTFVSILPVRDGITLVQQV